MRLLTEKELQHVNNEIIGNGDLTNHNLKYCLFDKTKSAYSGEQCIKVYLYLSSAGIDWVNEMNNEEIKAGDWVEVIASDDELRHFGCNKVIVTGCKGKIDYVFGDGNLRFEDLYMGCVKRNMVKKIEKPVSFVMTKGIRQKNDYEDFELCAVDDEKCKFKLSVSFDEDENIVGVNVGNTTEVECQSNGNDTVDWEVCHAGEWLKCIRFGLDINSDHVYQVAEGEYAGALRVKRCESSFRKARTEKEKCIERIMTAIYYAENTGQCVAETIYEHGLRFVGKE